MLEVIYHLNEQSTLIFLLLNIKSINMLSHPTKQYKNTEYNMLNYFTGFGASTNFEKNRLIATSKTLQPPEEYTLKKIIKTFQGDDEQTRSQIAFATIVKKILTSDSNDSWIYLLKNLIILDKVLESMCFMEEIADLSLPVVEGYVERNSHYSPLKTDEIVRNYWKLIKQTAKMLKTKKNIISYSRNQRSEFLQTLGAKQILKQIQSVQFCFKNLFTLVNSIQSTQGMDSPTAKAFKVIEKSKLMNYVKIQMLYKLISLYSSQMLCTNRFVSLLAKDTNMDLIQLEAIRNFKQLVLKFKANSNLIIEFVQRNKQLKGFEVINYRDFDPMPGNNIVKSIDKCISQRLSFDENNQNVQQYISDTPLKLNLRPKTMNMQQLELSCVPRKKIEAKRSDKTTPNSFGNYKCNYSEDFPQKQIMTIDLIMAIKKQKQQDRLSDYGDVINYNDRQTCIIPNNEQMPDHLQFKKPIYTDLTAKYTNLYSGLDPIWNID